MSACDELDYAVALHAVPGMGPVTYRRLVSRFGTARAVVEDTSPEALCSVQSVSRELADAVMGVAARLAWARETVQRFTQRGVRILRLSDPAYPAPLHDLPNPPPLLYMVGEYTPADARAVAMVGSTKPSDKGRRIAEEFAARLAADGVTVVSGYAHGVDAASHRGAFRDGGRSILCLPFGLRHFRPRPDFPPVEEIARRGAILSECPPEQEWSAAAAVARNRLIAALGRVVFVVETRPRGGTMHTVKAAEGLGRPVATLKYQDAPESARGNAILIAKGATAITRFGETAVLRHLVDA